MATPSHGSGDTPSLTRRRPAGGDDRRAGRRSGHVTAARRPRWLRRPQSAGVDVALGEGVGQNRYRHPLP